MITQTTSTNEYLFHLSSLPNLHEINYKYNLVSLFSGGGGLDLGLAFAGFRSVFSSDIEKPHCQTVNYNFPHCHVEQWDVRDLTGNYIRKVTNQHSFDLLCGGPPCQAFSILGKRDSFEDPRGQLVFEYVRLVKELSPRAFVFENVPGLLNVNNGEDWYQLLTYFEEETGYSIHSSVLNSANFGVPQIRKRVFVVGLKNIQKDFFFPVPTHSDFDEDNHLYSSLKNWIPAKFALEDVDNLPNQRLRPHGDRVRNRYKSVPVGGRDRVDRTDRIHPERPSGTVLVGSKAGGGRPFIHPYEPRHITVREGARLQSFPDWYEFCGTNTWQYRAVGNAVPPLLANAIGKSLVSSLE